MILVLLDTFALPSTLTVSFSVIWQGLSPMGTMTVCSTGFWSGAACSGPGATTEASNAAATIK